MRKIFSIALAFVVAGIGTAMAENYPSRPITIVVPFPAGGPTDALGRVLADRMKRALNQSVIVENVTGAAGTIGAAHVAHSAPDGYTTILGHWQTHVVNGATFTLSFDVRNDFELDIADRGLPDVVGGQKYFAAENGADVVGAYFQKSTGTRFQFVPYEWCSANNPGSVSRKYRPDF